MKIISEVGDWMTLKTFMPGIESEAGKVLDVDTENNKFQGIFFTEDDMGPSLEVEEWFLISKIFSIITDPKIIRGLEEDYEKC